ncbi:MAG: hypothetical protein ABFD16_09020 [Thermoguttaceae bacterium]|jgi:hypothetical protein
MLRIDEPFHGAVLNRRHGKPLDGGLEIQVRGEAPLDQPVTVNGVAARRAGNRFTADVVLRDAETELIATADGRFGHLEHRVRIVWDRNSFPRYRFSLEDNSFFLRDIAKSNYRSLFDCFYLHGLRELHQKYGTRFVMNLYYTTGDDFCLPQFPDRYQGEWQDNADWLRLAFHAHADKPDRPYQYAAPEEYLADMDRVTEEIVRFAGETCYAPPAMVHWGTVQPDTLKALFGRGVRVLSGYFCKLNGVHYDVNYLLDDVRSEYLSRHDALKDFESGLLFSRVDLVCNSVPVEKVASTLKPLAQDPNQAEIMDLFTHEQYFWPFYEAYIPDHFQRLDAALRWVTERGYQPVFLHEGFLGAPL